MRQPAEELRAGLADRYVLERELGRGGMATVYVARDLKHERPVALKVLDPELARALGPSRFQREIETAARLQHPHILPVHDSGEAAGQLWYTMPFVDGESLRARIRRERQLPLEDALRLGREVALALDYAHRRGVIHRDIKPENILLSDGQALVADFGIAKAAGDAGSERLTGTGLSLGTPAYMSPEQAAGSRELDGRSDQYSLGCVLYEMLAGEPPFTGPTPQAVIARRFVEPARPLRPLRAAVPESVERVVLQMLAREPVDRFATTGEIAAMLSTMPSARSVDWRTRAVSIIRKRPTRRLRLLAVVTMLGLGAAASGLWWRSRVVTPALDANLVAVAPFDVLDPKLAFWRDGLVDVFARTLDGLGPLHTVSPTIVLRRWRGRADLASAQALGRYTGARLAVLGQVIGVGSDSARLSASLIDVATGARRSEFEGSDRVERLSSLADSISLLFLRDLGISASGSLRLASVGTRSIVALKAFLQGEQHFRKGALDSAIASFERAVEADSTFTLALRRLASAYDWRDGQDAGFGRRFDLQAGRFNRGLSPRDSLLVLADSLQAAVEDTLLDSIARSSLVKRRFETLRAASRIYPGDPEVWYQLGETREHFGSDVVGSTLERVMNDFDRSIALDSSFAMAYVHPIAHTLYMGDCQRALTYLRKAASMRVPGMPRVAVVALLVDRMLHGSAGWHAEIQPTLDTLSGAVLSELARKVSHCPDTGETNIWLLRQLAGRPGQLSDPREPNGLLAIGLMNRGHLRQSYLVLRAQPIANYWSRLGFSQLALIGGVPRDTAAAVFRRWLNGPDFFFMTMALPWWAAQRDTSSIRDMMARAEAAARAATKENRNYAVARFTPDEVVRIARVYLALARADTAEAWRRLAHAPGSQNIGVVVSELTAAQGKDSAVAAMLEEGGNAEGPRYVLQRLLLAQVLERLDRPDEALRSYQFVLDMWRRADPELSGYVAEARAGVERLSGEKAQ